VIIAVPKDADTRTQIRALRRATRALEAKRKTEKERPTAADRRLEQARMKDKIRRGDALETQIKAAVAKWASAFWMAAPIAKPRESRANRRSSLTVEYSNAKFYPTMPTGTEGGFTREADGSDGSPSKDQQSSMLSAVNEISSGDLAGILAAATSSSFDDGVDHAGAEIHASQDLEPLILDNTAATAAIKKRV
jgi:hypothetical protein